MLNINRIAMFIATSGLLISCGNKKNPAQSELKETFERPLVDYVVCNSTDQKLKIAALGSLDERNNKAPAFAEGWLQVPSLECVVATDFFFKGKNSEYSLYNEYIHVAGVNSEYIPTEREEYWSDYLEEGQFDMCVSIDENANWRVEGLYDMFGENFVTECPDGYKLADFNVQLEWQLESSVSECQHECFVARLGQTD